MFTIGQVYNRRNYLHKKYGGNPQSGIAPCADQPIIFLFSSPVGSKHGYVDHWLDDSTFQYTGEGQFGDMDLIRGNKAIKNHEQDGRQLHLFEKKRSGEYQYIGEFRYLEHKIMSGEDTDNIRRRMIVFILQKK